MRFAENEYRWSTPVNKRFTLQKSGIGVEARTFVTSDQSGPLAVTFLHLADYLHRATWGRAGVPPYAFQIQANWIMWLSGRSEEHTSELQSLMRISYAVFCLKKKKTQYTHTQTLYINTQQ